MYIPTAWLTRLDIAAQVLKQPPTLNIGKYPLKTLHINQLFRIVVVYITVNILRILHKYQVIPAMVYISAAWLTSLDIPAQVSILSTLL